MKQLFLSLMICHLAVPVFAVIAPITGTTTICQGMPGVILSDATPGGFWTSSNTYVATVGSTTGFVTGTTPGSTTIRYIVGVDTASVVFRIITTPPAPSVTGTMQYCQYIGPFLPLTVHTTTSSDSARWYTTATGGTWTLTEPIPNLSVPGTYNYWVCLKDSGCEGPRTPLSIAVHPKPAPPVLVSTSYCQYSTASPVGGTPGMPGDVLTWYGTGLPGTGTTTDPTPSTSVAGVNTFFATETSIYGCVSDSSAMATITIIALPCTTGIPNYAGENKIALYPNPAFSAISIKGVSYVTVKVYNLTGQLLKTVNHTNSISIAELPAGMYFIKLLGDDGQIIYQDKIVIQ